MQYIQPRPNWIEEAAYCITVPVHIGQNLHTDIISSSPAFSMVRSQFCLNKSNPTRCQIKMQHLENSNVSMRVSRLVNAVTDC